MGSRARHRPRAGDQGQQGVRRLRPAPATRSSAPACRRPALVARSAGRRAARALLRDRVNERRGKDGTDLFSGAVPAPRTRTATEFSDEDIVNHMIFLMMAAHDTSTIDGDHDGLLPGRQPRLAGTLPRRIARRRHARPSRSRHLDRLETLDLVMRECMRLVTAVPGLGPQDRQGHRVLGYRIPNDTYVSVNMQRTHHLDGVLARSRTLRSRPVRPRRARRTATPGSRSATACTSASACTSAGMQVKAAMHQLLLGYRWSVPQDYEMPIDWSSLPRPKDGLPIRLEALTPGSGTWVAGTGHRHDSDERSGDGQARPRHGVAAVPAPAHDRARGRRAAAQRHRSGHRSRRTWPTRC